MSLPPTGPSPVTSPRAGSPERVAPGAGRGGRGRRPAAGWRLGLPPSPGSCQRLPAPGRFLPTDTLFITEGEGPFLVVGVSGGEKPRNSHAASRNPTSRGQGRAGAGTSALCSVFRAADGAGRACLKSKCGALCEGAVTSPVPPACPGGPLGRAPSAPPSTLTAALSEAPRGLEPSGGGTETNVGDVPGGWAVDCPGPSPLTGG